MYVADWMTMKVYSASPDECIANALRMMRDLHIRHIPVIIEDRIKGIISLRDINEYIPSKSATLDMHDLNYVLENTPIMNIMHRKVITTSEDTPIEEAAMIMYDKRIGCLPVTKDDRLAGIISDRDIFRAMIDITGIRNGGHRISLILDDRPRGAIKEIADIVRKHGFGIQSILTSFQKVEAGCRRIVIRTKGRGQYGALKVELMGSYRDVKFRKEKS